ncbi:MAG: aminoacetone oxidase family FAD-binding enzyme [Bacilli bacterium]|nr:aminoacetone oxidase family FAD-binding enzyme [Bacilli bacterium]
MKRIIIIGGGASGLTASIFASQNNNKVTILEKNNSCGKKILITGNGKCNYFNEDFNIFHYKSNNIDILKQIITEQNKKEILNFFDNLGIMPKIKNGYYYPNSNQSVSIKNALELQSTLNKVDIKTEVLVEKVQYKNNEFIVKTNKGIFISDELILASGSKASPKTGSDGLGYDIASSLGHLVIKPLPALVQLKSDNKFLKEIAGVRSDVNITMYENNNKIDFEQGEILFTDYGISGISVFQLSSLAARLLDDNKKISVKIDLMPLVKSKKEMFEYINNINDKAKNRNIQQLLDGFLNYKISNVLLKMTKISKETAWQNLTDIQKEELIYNIKEFELKIIGTNSYENAQTCSGGIPLNEININTMESLKQKHLYIIGELLDVDGDCGGYNLGFAWLSGMLAGIEVGKK